jgi:transposase
VRTGSLGGYCQGCLEKQREIDRLKEDNRRLRDRLRYQERIAREQGPFGSSTPSSKIPLKANTELSLQDRQARRGGARPGHVGHGRKTAEHSEADEVVTLEAAERTCPQCGEELQEREFLPRTVIEIPPPRTRTILYRLGHRRCPRCRRHFRARAPATVLPRSLLGNQLLAHLAVQHYVFGVPLGRLEAQTAIGYGTLIGALHRLARLFAAVPERLVLEYRSSPVKHADETGWRTDGQNGYAWLFATATLSIFRFRSTRSASVAHEVLGSDRLPGVLGVDRYNGYNKAPVALQYCYAHLLREVQDCGREFEDNVEVQRFVDVFAPLLASAMALRRIATSDDDFRRQADALKQQILDAVEAPAQHPGIHRLQGIFRDHPERLYHWAAHRSVPADNNLAERELRPLVIARKVSFGSQSDAGAHTRETLMTVLVTLRRRFPDDFSERFKNTLDQLARNAKRDPYTLLFHNHPPP